MSRLSTLSPAALRAMFSQDSDATLISLLTLTGAGIATPVRLSDGYTHRFEWLSESAMKWTNLDTGASSAYIYLSADAATKDAVNSDPANPCYGVISAGVPYIFIPFNLTLPTEEQASAPRCNVTIHDATRLMTPVIRQISVAPTVGIKLVLSKTPDITEATFPGFKMGAITYNSDTIAAELTVESLAIEPFPAHVFTPSYFPGLF